MPSCTTWKENHVQVVHDAGNQASRMHGQLNIVKGAAACTLLFFPWMEFHPILNGIRELLFEFLNC